MDRQRLWFHVRRIWVATGLTATAIFVSWSLLAYRATPAARAALAPDSAVTVGHDDGVWRFTPARASGSSPALVFFPGGLVDPIAYAPLARAAAAAGFPAYIVELPRRGAFGGAEDPALRARLDRLLADPRTPSRWVAAGHSLGGKVASRIAREGGAGRVGLVLIGTSHPRDVDLGDLEIPVAKIVGTRDGLASAAKVAANRHLLPARTEWVVIAGGNHSQFGWYGFQPGDRRATIDAAAQRSTMIRTVIGALRGGVAGPVAGD